ncbi:LytR C-terminal domain-containing protein [candidate division KSB1 bacterium]|nr:LytR C-terminal domain-containing protein [candidate division KSB1 bacterium]
MNRRVTKKKKIKVKSPVYKRSTTKNKSAFATIKQKVNLLVIWGLVVINAVLISSFIHKIVTPQQVPDIISTTPIINPVRVQVLNGCGVSGIANEFSEYLQRQRYDVVEVGNAPTWDYENTVIINRERRDKKDIDKFREIIGISDELVYPIKNDENDSDITLIIGSDYESLKIYKSLR